MLLCIGHSAVLRTLPLSGSLNRRICGSLTLAQISPYGETSHIPRTLYAIGFGTLIIYKKQINKS